MIDIVARLVVACIGFTKYTFHDAAATDITATAMKSIVSDQMMLKVAW